MVVLEAMALGLPVIASAVGGIPEVIEDGLDGYLISPGDVASLTKQSQAIVEDPHMLRTIGERARQRVAAEYSIQTVAQRHKILYESLVG